MASPPRSISPNNRKIRPSGPRFIYQPTSTSMILFQVPNTSSRGDQSPPLPVACRTVVRLPSDPPNTEGHQEDLGGGGGGADGGTSLATAPVVCRPGDTFHLTPMENTAPQDLPQLGGPATLGPSVAPVGHLALERGILRKGHFSGKVISTILASQRASTNRIYEATWASFCR